MKFLVLGVSGMAGHVISIYLKESGHDVTGVSRKPVNFVKSLICDVKDTDLLSRIIRDGNYDAIINAVGLLNQYAENNHEAAAFVNGYLPHFLAKITADMNTQIIHMSTDCVFSGKTGPYTEDSFCDGETFYDRSKAFGELRDSKNLTLRNSIIGPDINKNGIGLFNWFMKQDGPINGYSHAMWTGLTTLELAKVMEYAALHKCTGLVNMVYKENISKFDLLRLFNHYMKNDSVVINPYDDFVADKTLIRTDFSMDYLIPSYESMISEMSVWIKEHSSLYPHYAV